MLLTRKSSLLLFIIMSFTVKFKVRKPLGKGKVRVKPIMNIKPYSIHIHSEKTDDLWFQYHHKIYIRIKSKSKS